MIYWITIIITALAIIFSQKVLAFLSDNLLLNVQKGTYIKIILMAGICILLYVGYNNSSNSSPVDYKTIQRNMLVQNAFGHAKNAVKEQLKAPSTAKFADGYDKESKYKINEDESVVIQSYVDAQNSFGAMIRTHYRCTVDKYGKVSDLITW